MGRLLPICSQKAKFRFKFPLILFGLVIVSELLMAANEEEIKLLL